MALGALNNRCCSARSCATPAHRRWAGRSSAAACWCRLGLITLLAFALALLVRPDGLGVFAGLAVFQVLMLVGAAVPVFRSLRRPS